MISKKNPLSICGVVESKSRYLIFLLARDNNQRSGQSVHCHHRPPPLSLLLCSCPRFPSPDFWRVLVKRDFSASSLKIGCFLEIFQTVPRTFFRNFFLQPKSAVFFIGNGLTFFPKNSTIFFTEMAIQNTNICY